MSLTSIEPTVAPRIVQSKWQPDIALPYDVLHIVMTFYTGFRLEEVEHSADDPVMAKAREKFKKVHTEWPIVPVLQTCKMLHDMVVPLLYHTVVTIGSIMTRAFLGGPALASYKHTREIRFQNAGKSAISPVNDRLTQGLLLWTIANPEVHGLLKSSVQHAKDAYAGCLRTSRPPIKVMYLSGNIVKFAERLLFIFDVEHLVLEDFHYASRDEVPQLPFSHCRKITLISTPTLSYKTTDSYWFPDSDELPKYDQIESLELQIGWRGPRKLSHQLMHRERSPLAIDTIPDLVASLCSTHAPFGSITISPYLGKTRQCYQWCFGKELPREIVAPPRYPTVRFVATCHCGNGEETGFWESLYDVLHRQMEGRWKKERERLPIMNSMGLD